MENPPLLLVDVTHTAEKCASCVHKQMGKISIPDSCVVPFLILIDHGCHMLQTQFQQALSAALILAGVQNRLSALQEQSMGGEKRLLLCSAAA